MIKRRNFISTAIGATAALSIPQITYGSSTLNETPQRVLPKRLKKGDTIGLIAPGYAIPIDALDKSIKTLESMGFKTYHTQRIIGNHGYFSATDEERAADLNEMFSNPQIDGIVCARGGYGCTRIMQMIDYACIKENPKVLVGFSDVTALLNGIYIETGLVGFHGPVGSTLDDPYSIEQLEKVIINPSPKFTIENATLTPTLKKASDYQRYIINDGVAEGKIVGGSLTLINALVGTPHEIDFTNAIVCIEDIEEAPYRIDRMLTQLIEGDTFKNAAGIVLGVFAGCDTSKKSKKFTLKEVLIDRLKPLNIPTVYGMSFGHVKNNFTFPIGINARLTTASMNLELLEQAVL